MGRWAQRKRTGGTNHYGILTAPDPADWTLTSPSAGLLRFSRLIPVPPPGTNWFIRFRDALDIPWIYSGPWMGTPADITGLPTGHTFHGEISWWSATAQLSPWSAIKGCLIT